MKRLLILIAGLALTLAIVLVLAPTLSQRPAEMAIEVEEFASELEENLSASVPPPDEVIILEEPVMIAPPEPEEPFFNVRVSFATNRGLSADPGRRPADQFTSDHGVLLWGQADVSIPTIHTRGELETPGWLERKIFGMDPARHIVLQDVLIGTEDAVLSALRTELANTSANAVLLYVHGYSTTFEKAARRMAQMKHDLEFDGPAVFFSWPSKGATAAYPHDSNMVRVTQPRMKEVLAKLSNQGADRVVVIAHSMGTQILSYALTDLIREDPEAAARIRTVILAAPDIDARVFTEQLAPAFRALPEPVTLYASSNDTALKASRRFNGYDRIGDASEVLQALEGIVVIDASNVISDFFGHVYFAENTSILSDIYRKVNLGLSADKREGLVQIDTETGAIWRITGP
ncbi:alpha/beta hydrolase [Thalassococcus sp. S3]|uniref:alpha/beta hydrolase n=1 Tax=Thalassococcus sp. S3 TaxID=2017482 RepID=UPI0010243852|nr:alpha/beta hydrolase [Thalassococcus sp. S3]QBF30938.1 hypothetical protein CFI11_06865 [Thalassococcus sp. S3]